MFVQHKQTCCEGFTFLLQEDAVVECVGLSLLNNKSLSLLAQLLMIRSLSIALHPGPDKGGSIKQKWHGLVRGIA